MKRALLAIIAALVIGAIASLYFNQPILAGTVLGALVTLAPKIIDKIQ